MNKVSSKLANSVRKAKETEGDETQNNETEVSNNTPVARSAQSEKKSPPSSPSKSTPRKKVVNDEVPRPKLSSNRVWPD